MATPSRQRLVIQEMVLTNFKSYAGEQRIGPFHKARMQRAFARRPAG
jgi:structural maintenance of chromosome 4